MKKILLGGVAVAALAVGYAGSAWADHQNLENQQNDCTGTCSNTQEDTSVTAGAIADENSSASESGGIATVGEGNSGTAIAGGDAPIAEDGASVVTGDENTTTSVGSADAVASNGSTAIDDGAFVVGDGAALGENANQNAVAVNGSTAVFYYGDEDAAVAAAGSTAMDDSAFAVGGDRSINIALSDGMAENGSAAVIGGENTVVSNNGGSSSFADNGSAVVIGDGNFTIATTGSVANDDGTAVGLGNGNAVSAAHLDQNISSKGGDAIEFLLSGSCSGLDCDANSGDWLSGDIGGAESGNVTGPAIGINSALFNTGLVNQGRPVAVSAIASFNGPPATTPQ